MKPRPYDLFIFFLITISFTARSDNPEAHTHGLASLTLALENDTLEIQFASPAANLVGFEHKAMSTEESRAVTRAEITLKEPEELFSFVGANCEPSNTNVDVSGVVDSELKKHHGHSKEHDHSGHSEISASYRFSCKDAKNLAFVSVELFSKFPGIEKINAMWITEIKQGTETLTSAKHAVSLR